MASIPVVPAADAPQWFGHPRQLARLFTTEAMERFGYYGMRALLTLYLADHFLFSATRRRRACTAASPRSSI